MAFYIAPVNPSPPNRQRTEQQARQEVKQQTSTRGIIMIALGDHPSNLWLPTLVISFCANLI